MGGLTVFHLTVNLEGTFFKTFRLCFFTTVWLSFVKFGNRCLFNQKEPGHKIHFPKDDTDIACVTKRT